MCPEAVAHSAAKGAEFIVVVPDTFTKMGGSMYSSSVTTGDFEAFVAKDLVSYVDSHYRTIAKREARGLAGHSMGGYGTWKVGMKYPGPWNAIYAMSACCGLPRSETLETATKLASVPFETAPTGNFGVAAALASAAAWSPAPDKPPYYIDFPDKDGKLDTDVLAQWAANSPLTMVSQYVWALKSYKAIGSDVRRQGRADQGRHRNPQPARPLRHQERMGGLSGHPHQRDRPALRTRSSCPSLPGNFR